MSHDHVDRRLAAILAADVVVYSRMMATDETATLTAFKLHRQCFFDPMLLRLALEQRFEEGSEE
ncbi:hypothetical protein ACC702_38830, partial [Rhizobium ruizarguesonis]